MQTLEFTRALKKIVEELKVRELLALLGPWLTPSNNEAMLDSSKDRFSELVLGSNTGYQDLLRRSATRKVLEQFQVAALYEPGRLRAMITAVSTAPQSQTLVTNWQNFIQFYSFFELLRSFQMMESACKRLLDEEKVGQIPDSDAILELELIEYSDEVGISPERLEIFISTIKELRRNLAIIFGIQGGRLTFKYFDSGSGFLIGITDVKVIVEGMSTLLNQWWEKIRFWRFETFDKRIEAVSKGLSLVETIQQAIEKGTITEEEGGNLKLRVFREVETLTGIGVTTPLGDDVTIDQRQLLTEIRDNQTLRYWKPRRAKRRPA